MKYLNKDLSPNDSGGLIHFSLATIFEGALITEVVFSYPGLGYTIYRAIVSADYNLIMGITILSIIGIATISLIIDLTYPLFDPRIKLK